VEPADSIERGSDTGSLVTLAAPGGGVVGHAVGVTAIEGTSFAAPHVAGVAGLLKSFDPRLSADSLKILLVNGAANGHRKSGGYDYLDAYESLKLASARRGAPICGNRVWAEGGNVLIERGAAAVDTVPTGDTATIEVNPLHGGRRIVTRSFAATRAFRWAAPGTWVSDTVTAVSFFRPGSAGFVNSVLHGSHDGDTTITAFSGEVWRHTAAGNSIIGTVPSTSTQTASTLYCPHEFVRLDPAAVLDSAQQTAWNAWYAQQGYAQNTCPRPSSYTASARGPDWFPAYSPRYDSAVVAVMYVRTTESISAPMSCVDAVPLKTAAGDAFSVNVEYRCIAKTRLTENDGRNVYMISFASGQTREITTSYAPTWYVTSVGLAEDGREMVERYERSSEQITEQWLRNDTTMQWHLFQGTTSSHDCVMRYELIATGALQRQVGCGGSTPQRAPAVVSPNRMGGGRSLRAAPGTSGRSGAAPSSQHYVGAVMDRVRRWFSH
jgi:hypothetical protein